MKFCFIANGSKNSVFPRMWIKHFSKNHDVDLITYEDPDPIYQDLCLAVKHITGSFLKKAADTRSQVKWWNPDLLIGMYLEGCGYYASLSNFHPFLAVPLGTDIASYPGHSRYAKWKISYILKKADYVQVQDPLAKDRVIQLGSADHKIILNKWGADLTKFKPMNVSKDFDLINVHASSKRDCNTYIDAVKIVVKEYPDLKCLLLGNPDPFLVKINKLDLLDHFTLPGYVNQDLIPGFLNRSRIFIDCFHANHNFGGHTYGIALCEAMACSIPTIAANKKEIDEQKKNIESWYYGSVFNGGDPADLAAKIIELLQDPKKQKEIAAKNRSVIVDYFDWNKNIAKIEKSLWRLL